MRGLRPPVWLGAGGYALLALAAALAAAATALDVPWPVAAFVATLAVCVVLGIEIARDRDALELRRSVPARLMLGHAVSLHVRAANRGRRAIRAGIVEGPVAGVQIAIDAVGGTLAPGDATTFEIACVPLERGATTFSATYAWFEAEWRIVRHRVRIDDPVGAFVLPEVPAFSDTDDLALRARLHDAGLRRLHKTGAGGEFAGLREYAPGDAFRDIDWKATARGTRVMVAERDVERSQQIALVVDAGRMMAARIDGRRKLDIAISSALGIAALAQSAGDRVGVHAFAGTTLARVPPLPGSRAFAAILHALSAVEPHRDEPDYERAALEIQRTYRKRSLIVVFTDLFDPVASATLLGVLGSLARRHVVIVALLNDGVLAQAVADERPESAVRRAVARELAAERASAVASLRARGMLALDVPAARLRPAVLDAYVAIVQRGRL